jgi:hypothetical protein
MPVTDIDKGFAKRVAQILKAADANLGIEVGILDPDKTHVDSGRGKRLKRAIKRAQDRYKKALKISKRKPKSKAAQIKVQHTKNQVERAKVKATTPSTARQPTIGEIAERHEFGLGVPQRSFIRAWYNENQSKILDDIRKLTKAALDGKMPAKRAFELLGARFQGDIQKRMSAGIAPANAPATVKRKGSSTPLIDTGQLRSAISWRLVTK